MTRDTSLKDEDLLTQGFEFSNPPEALEAEPGTTMFLRGRWMRKAKNHMWYVIPQSEIDEQRLKSPDPDV